MKRLSPVLARATPEWELDHGDYYLHWCPGCKQLHPINTTKPNSFNAVWSFNGNVEKPTFSPSVNMPGRCHYFITDGQIIFCPDSKHEFSGRTVPLPPIPEDML